MMRWLVDWLGGDFEIATLEFLCLDHLALGVGLHLHVLFA
jgi:hypothetical protein